MTKKKFDEVPKNRTSHHNNTSGFNPTAKSPIENEEKYRNILESIQEGYFEIDLAGNYTFVNDALCEIHGYSKEELIGMNDRQYMDKETAKRAFRVFNKVFQTEIPVNEIDWPIIRKDGSRRHVDLSISLLKDSFGKSIGFRGIVRDITERKKIEEKLHKEEQRFRILTEQSSDLITIVDTEGKIVYQNQAVEKVLGYKPQDRIGSNMYDKFHPD